jgi:hypothetical protein
MGKKDKPPVITGRPLPKPKSCSQCPYIGSGCPYCG